MRIDDYAELVAHFQIRQAVTESVKDRMATAGEIIGDPMAFDLVKVVGSPAIIACMICGEIVGHVYSISGESKKYESLADLPNGGPPFHPHCTHNLAPWIEGLSK
jgi:hypothetical protein